MTDDTEQQLRKALGAVNDIEPPRDDLFVQRAIMRGRAKTSRRRGAILGAAAGVALVGVLGGTWIMQQVNPPAQSTAASAPERAPSDAQANGAPAPQAPGAGVPTPADNRGSSGFRGSSGSGGGSISSTDTNVWLTGASSPQRTAFDAIAATLAADYPDVFAGAYATDAANTHLVVTVTRHDAALESLVTGAMPAAGDVEFKVALHTAAEKLRVAGQIRSDTAAWAKQGVTIQQVTVDARTDRVVVTIAPAVSPPAVSPPRAARDIAQRYGAGLVVVVQGLAQQLPGPHPPELSIPVTPPN